MNVRVKDYITIMEKYFPLHLAEKWDNVGLQVGAVDKEVKRVVVCLDLDEQILDEAINVNADLIITHHPLFFNDIKRINYNTPEGRFLKSVLLADIAVYSAHTNLDAAAKGVNQVLAEVLELQNIQPLYSVHEDKLVKIIVFVPVTHVEQLQRAMYEAGAGFIGKYSDCSFRMEGIGTFRPGDDANPFLGTKGVLEEVNEFRLETVAYERDIAKIIKAVNNAHPYEEVACDIYPLLNQGKIYGMGRKGVLPQPLDFATCVQYVKSKLNLKKVKTAGDFNKVIKTVAVIGGSGGSLINKMIGGNIDLIITGDVKYHEAQEAAKWGIAVVDAGHQETEQIIIPYLADLLKKEIEEQEWEGEVLPLVNQALFAFF